MQDDLGVSVKLEMLLNKNNSNQHRKVLPIYFYQRIEEKNEKVYSYSRTLRHFDEIKQKVGQRALNQKAQVLYGRPGSRQQNQTRPTTMLNMLHPQSQNLMAEIETQTEEVPKSAQKTQVLVNTEPRSTPWVMKMLRIKRFQHTSQPHQHPIGISFTQVIQPQPILMTQKLKTNNLKNFIKQRAQSAKSPRGPLLEATLDKSQSVVSAKPVFKFSVDNKRTRRRNTQSPIL